MRAALLVSFLFCTAVSFSQHDYMLWSKLGVKGKVIKRLSWTAEINGRFNNAGLKTFFPQAGLEYKVTKWCRPSVEYRFIIDKNRYGNYKSSNRINFNLNLKESVKRFAFGVRLRYQYAFDRISNENYDADFDQAIRIKPVFEYDINNSIFTPVVSAEFFYNPAFGPEGRRFNKMRVNIGSKLELKGPHGVSFKYQLDKRFYDFSADLRHVLAIGYSYRL